MNRFGAIAGVLAGVLGIAAAGGQEFEPTGRAPDATGWRAVPVIEGLQLYALTDERRGSLLRIEPVP